MQQMFIPVILQFDIPTSWDKRSVFEAIDELRLTRTSDMNIKIKAILFDDLKSFAEIANTTLYNVLELSCEICKIMSTDLSEAAIITAQSAEVGVNLNIPDRKGKSFFVLNFRLSDRSLSNMSIYINSYTYASYWFRYITNPCFQRCSV